MSLVPQQGPTFLWLNSDLRIMAPKIVPRPPQEAPDYLVLQDELERSQNKIEELSAELARMTRKNEALQAEVDKLTRTKEMMSRSLQRLQRPDYKPLILESDRASAGAPGRTAAVAGQKAPPGDTRFEGDFGFKFLSSAVATKATTICFQRRICWLRRFGQDGYH